MCVKQRARDDSEKELGREARDWAMDLLLDALSQVTPRICW